MAIKVETGRECVCCSNHEAFIAIGKWRQPNQTFSDILSNQVCWECYVAVLHPVDRKLANAKARIKAVFNRPDSYRQSGQYRKDMRNAEAWEEAIRNKATQRQIYSIL